MGKDKKPSKRSDKKRLDTREATAAEQYDAAESAEAKSEAKAEAAAADAMEKALNAEETKVARDKALQQLLEVERTIPMVAGYRAKEEAEGAAVLQMLPYDDLGTYAPLEGRPDPVELLEEQNETRVPNLVPIRRYRMVQSPFTFYRGAARVMASDLCRAPHTGMSTQICGDAHLSNFGLFGTPERQLIFDINDFDETIVGPWEFDVKRLITSLVVAARDNGLSVEDQRTIAYSGAKAYRSAMLEASARSPLEVQYAAASVENISQALPNAEARKRLMKIDSKARTHDSQRELTRIAELENGRWRIKDAPPQIIRFEEMVASDVDIRRRTQEWYQDYQRSLEPHRRKLLERYEVVDAALKIVGVGSVGTRCFIVLLIGRYVGAPLFLQVKQAEDSVYEEFLHTQEDEHDGMRVVHGQRQMQAASDMFLGWGTGADGNQYYWRQLKDWKGSVDIARMGEIELETYAALCATTLARGHARGESPQAIAAYLGDGEDFAGAIVGWAFGYAEQNEADYAEFKKMIDAGELECSEG